MVSHWGHAVGYDCNLPSTSYSYQMPIERIVVVVVMVVIVVVVV